MKKIVIFGAGEGGQEILKVVIDDINKISPTWEVVGFIDSDIKKKGTSVFGYPVLGNKFDQAPQGVFGICGVMNNEARHKIIDQEILGKGFSLATLIHPSVIMTDDLLCGPGTVIFPGCKISYNVRLGKGVFVNYNCLLGHGLVVDDLSFLGPSVTIPGGCQIGRFCTIGAGSNLLHGISVGDNTTIGIGTTLIQNVGKNKLVMDLPRKMDTDKK